ncbi:ArsC family reductase [Gluconobacter thailandicus]|uniref:ArsC family reductase n=1 Tax=Gluconobacter thailandicus TaxID=257438 RepID=A0AAP9EQ46_GLUTH|nr:ArsC family reductase [Gluconobacter thailandicus]QEH95413.1 ArsC family reductase [Gluconobacter thailandicus]
MTASVVMYGIKACDTMKKARAWLDEQGVSYIFHDYKKDGISEEILKTWISQIGWDVLLNKAGTTFRKLPPEQKKGLTEERAVTLMLAQPSMIKRPVLTRDGTVTRVGFRPADYEETFPA